MFQKKYNYVIMYRVKGSYSMATRSELREKIMTILYQIELYNKNEIEYNIDDVVRENVEIENEFVKDMVYGVTSHMAEIDELANENLKDWKIERIDSMGRAILRMGIYELKYMDTPDLVVINEAVELAKKYSIDDVRKMINAVLDKLVNE